MQTLSFVRIATAVILAAVLNGAAVPGQSGRPSGTDGSYRGSTSSSLPSNTVPNSGPNMRSNVDLMGEPDSRETLFRREAARKLERKKRMVDSANRLLALTEQLRTELQTREPTPNDAVRLDEIAKLARTVKDQMRQ